MMRKFLKTVAGILASGTAFSLSLLLLVRLFGWPGLTPPLMGMLAVAWVAGASAGGKLAGGWAAGISLLLAVGLVGAVAYRAWREGAGELVTWRVDATFAYVGSPENKPLENVAVFFPVPRAENGGPVGEYFIGWRLYKVDENGVWHLQHTCNYDNSYEPVNLYPPRESLLVEIDGGTGLGGTPDGLRMMEGGFYFDRLYPGEVVWVYGWTVTREKKVTLRLPNDNRSEGTIRSFVVPGEIKGFEFPIHVVVWAKLSKLVKGKNGMYYRKVEGEEYKKEMENHTGEIGFYLYPIS
ncbi:MAG: hypothetical protein QW788_05340 [Candidatus Hadarchaeales archaeon]